jgi:hypothetical protein
MIKIIKIDRIDKTPDEFESHISTLTLIIEGTTNTIENIQKCILQTLSVWAKEE